MKQRAFDIKGLGVWCSQYPAGGADIVHYDAWASKLQRRATLWRPWLSVGGSFSALRSYFTHY